MKTKTTNTICGKWALLLLLCVAAAKASAYDIAVENEYGVTIYYNYINEGKELEVTRMGQNYRSYSGTVVIPEEVTYMNRTRKVTSIEKFAFSNCSDLASVTIPDGITSIGLQAFFYCEKLTSVTLPNSITSIGKDAFEYCKNLRSINIPDQLTAIEECTFGDCESLEAIVIPNSVTSIGNSAFSRCRKMASVEFGNGLTSIGSDAFFYCQALTTVHLPDGVTTIGAEAFKGCSSLVELLIPQSVRAIDKAAFYCENLATVVSYIANPFMIEGSRDDYNEYYSVFSDNTFFNATLYVPKGTTERYKAMEGWKDFVWIEEMEGEQTACTVKVEATAGGSVTINGAAQQSAKVEKGTDVVLKFVADEGYALQLATVNGADITSQIVNGFYVLPNVSEDVTVAVQFVEQSYALTIQYAESGSVRQMVKGGQSYTYQIVPSDDWRINTVMFNDEDVTAQLTADGQFTTPAITRDGLLNISFEQTGQTAVASAAALSKAKVYAIGGQLCISGAAAGDHVAIYRADGTLERQLTMSADEFTVSLPTAQTYIVTVGEKTVKIRL